MSDTCLTAQKIEDYLGATLPAEELMAVDQHLPGCTTCRSGLLEKGRAMVARWEQEWGLGRGITCLRTEVIQDYLERALPPEEAEIVEAALQSCPRCRARAEELRAWQEEVETWPEQPWGSPAPFWDREFVRFLPSELLQDPQRMLPPEAAQRLAEVLEERRGEPWPLAVLRWELNGVTELESRSPDPEATARLLWSVLEQGVRFVQHQEGLVHRFVGDGFEALFPDLGGEAPGARALRAALVLRDLVGALGRKQEAPLLAALTCTAGIAEGYGLGAVCDPVHGAEFVALEPLVERASALESLARPGQVLVTPAMVERARERFSFQRLSLTEVEDPPYELIGPRLAPVVPLVGRETEMQVLREGVRALQAGQGQVISLVGEAGIGKTRLLEELQGYLQEEGIAVYRGQCRPNGSAEPYQPFLEILRQIYGVGRREEAAVVREKLEPTILAQSPDLRWAVPYLVQAFSEEEPSILLPDERLSHRLRTIEAIGEVLAAQARQPLVLLLDSWEWADPGSEKVLQLLVDRAASRPLLLVCAYRPQITRKWVNQPHHTGLTLSPLSAAASGDLLRSLLPEREIPASLAAEMIAHSEGNPYTLKARASCLAEAKLSLASPGEDLQASLVEGNVVDLLAWRKQQLAPAPQTLLETAAAMGSRVDAQVLRFMAPDGEDLERHLTELKARALLRESLEERETTYVFDHELTRDGLYDGLPADRRRELHETIARAYEELYADHLEPYLDLLAHHYDQSGHVSKALHYLPLAAARAEARYDHKRTRAYCQRTWELLAQVGEQPEQGPVKLEILKLWGDVEALTGQLDHAVQTYQAGIGLARQLGDETTEGRMVHNLAKTRFGQGAYEQARDLYEQALRLRRKVGDRFGELGTRLGLGSLFYFLGDYPTALQHFENALALQQELGEDYWPVYQNLAAIHEMLGHYPQALAYCEYALQLAQNLGDRRYTMYTTAIMGKIYANRGRYRDALELQERAMELALDIGERLMQVQVIAEIGRILFRLGDYHRAQERFQESAGLYHVLGNREQEALLQTHLAVLALALGRLDEAEEKIEEITQSAPSLASREVHAALCLVQGDLALPRGQGWEALAHYEQALQSYRETGHRREEIRALGKCADALQALGREEEALTATLQARELAAALEAWPLVALSYLREARLRAARGETDAALDAADGALRLGEAISSPSLLWRAHAARARMLHAYPAWAIAAYRQAVEILEQQRAQCPDEPTRRTFVQTPERAAVYAALVELLRREGQEAEAQHYAELSGLEARRSAAAQDQT